jgi:hypothetical protein
VVARHQAAGLQRGGNDTGFVVQLCPGDERIAFGRQHAVAHEPNPGALLGGGDQASDDRVGVGRTRWHDEQR